MQKMYSLSRVSVTILIAIYICYFTSIGRTIENVYADSYRAIVSVPITDVRSKPESPTMSREHDPLEETQILYGEEVRVIKVEGDWANVEVMGQEEFSHNKKWEGYPGWVERSNLSNAYYEHSKLYVKDLWAEIRTEPSKFSKEILDIPFGTAPGLTGSFVSDRYTSWAQLNLVDGTRGWINIESLTDEPRKEEDKWSETRARNSIWKYAKLFLRTPYYWGGRSPYKNGYKRAVTGVDCSGLVNLTHMVTGVSVPRDSHEQWMRSRRVKRKDLKRGDLVFLSSTKDSNRIVHVMIYVGGEFLIEGPGTGLNVRRITFKKKLGKRLDLIEDGMKISNRYIYFGTYMGETKS